jgi:phosphatidylinositol alpha-1,6-mannosyltransferase
MNAKAILLTYDFPPIHSGIGSYFYSIWKQANLKETIILAPRFFGYADFDKNLSVKVIRYPNFSKSRIIRIALIFAHIASLRVKFKINLLFCGAPLSLGFIGLILRKIFGIPYAVFYYGGEYAKYYQRKTLMFILGLILRNARWVITNSEYTSSEACKFGIKPDSIVKLTPGIDFTKFHPGIGCAAIKEKYALVGKKIILTVARLVRRKGIDAVINALPPVLNSFPDLVYIVIGSGKEASALKNLVKARKIEKNVIFLDSIPDQELPAYYNACDVYVMLNRVTKGDEILEGFGISFIEASACAKPVIAGVSGGVADAVLNNETGLLVEPDNVEEVSANILKVLNDQNYARRLGENGRRRMEREFTLESRAQKIADIIKETGEK